jgi:alpha-beta hydrolase superfamily lysophospholipase
MQNSESDFICKKITFSSNGFLLRGTLHHPATDRPPVVIGSHGLLSSSRSPKQIHLAIKCNEYGIAFFRFDHRGRGQSDGIFKNVTSIEARCNDLISAIKTIRTRKDIGDRIGLFGSSMGGAVCISVAAELNVDSLVIFAAPVSSRSIIEAPEKSDISDTQKSLFVKKYLQSNISEKLSRLHHILIFHGDSDNLVPPSNAMEIYEKAGKPKKLIMQKDGDHRMSNKEHQENFIREAALWFKTCFEST